MLKCEYRETSLSGRAFPFCRHPLLPQSQRWFQLFTIIHNSRTDPSIAALGRPLEHTFHPSSICTQCLPSASDQAAAAAKHPHLPMPFLPDWQSQVPKQAIECPKITFHHGSPAIQQSFEQYSKKRSRSTLAVPNIFPTRTAPNSGSSSKVTSSISIQSPRRSRRRRAPVL